MSDDHNWHELIDRHLRGELNESEKERLAERLDSDPSARKEFVEHVQWDTQLAEVLRESSAGLRFARRIGNRGALASPCGRREQSHSPS